MIIEDCIFDSFHVYGHCTLIYTIQLLLYQSLGSFMIVYVSSVQLYILLSCHSDLKVILLNRIEVDSFVCLVNYVYTEDLRKS